MSIGSLGYGLGAGGKVFEQYYRALQTSFGTALSTAFDAPLRRAELYALTNVFVDLNQAIRRVQAESLPGTSSQGLQDWAQRLGVDVFPGDSDALVRASCAGKYKAQGGGTPQNIIDVIETTLGNSLVGIEFTKGADAEPYTYWAGVNPGQEIDLGGDAIGEFSSVRSHILIVLRPLPGQTIEKTQSIVESKLFSVLDTLLPAYATWDYQISNDPYEGFILDESLLDITAL